MDSANIFLGWQPLLIAVAVYMVTQMAKSILDAAMGAQKRKSNRVLTRVMLPALPPVLGALFALAPVRPQVLVDYASANHLPWAEAQLVFSVWGAACGQFADYAYSKAKALALHGDE